MFDAGEPTPASDPLDQDEVDRMFEADEPKAGGQTLEQDEVDRLLDGDPPAAAPPTAAQAPLMLDPKEREAVPPAPALRLVADTPAAAPVPAKPKAGPAPTAPAESASAGPKSPANSVDEIIDYWDGLRGDKPFPRLDQIDRTQIGRTWPNCLLVGFGPVDTTTPQITRLGKENGDVEYGEMVIHWILSRGRVAARRSEPIEEEKRFPVTGGQARYQLLLLPLGTREGKSEHVLCHLSRIPEVNRGNALKRWFAS
jgi:hypothetical protein